MAVSSININSLLGAVLYTYTSESNTFSKALNAFLDTQRGLTVEYIDLRDQVIDEVKFDGIKFFTADFSNTTFKRCSFNKTEFTKCVLDNTIFEKSVLFDCLLEKCNPVSSAIKFSLLSNVRFSTVLFDSFIFTRDTLRNVQFDVDCTFTDTEFSSLSLDSRSVTNIIENDQLSLLTEIRADLETLLYDLFIYDSLPALISKLNAGEIDGSKYEGEYANLLGTVANILEVNYTELAVMPDFYRSAEVWFLLINVGDTPDNSALMNITENWVSTYYNNIGIPL